MTMESFRVAAPTRRHLHWAVVFASVLAYACAAGCAKTPQQDPGARGDPALRLIGHWSTDAGDQLYYGPIDGATGQGAYTLIQGSGNAFRHRYSIQSSDAAVQSIRATYHFVSGGTAGIEFSISADGNTLTSTQDITGMRITTDATRVDDKVAP